MPYEGRTGWVEFRPVSSRSTRAIFHLSQSCPHFQTRGTEEGPMLLGHAERYRGLDVCACVPDRGVHHTRWKRAGFGSLYHAS